MSRVNFDKRLAMVCSGVVVLAAVTAAGAGSATHDVDLIAATGDHIEKNATIDLLQPPFTNGLGQVGFTGRIEETNERFVWIDDGVAFWGSDAPDHDLANATSTMGIGNDGQWMYNPQIDGQDGIYTSIGALLKRADPSPTEKGMFATFNSRLQMTPDGTMYWISGLNDNPDSSASQERVMYKVDQTGEFTKIFRTGDVVAGGLEIRLPSGVGFDYHISDNGEHHIHRLQTSGSAPYDFVYVDDTAPLFRGDPVGDGTNWDLFRAVSINDTGNYVVSGSTSGGNSGERNFLVANGDIAIRSGDTVGGTEVPENASVDAASINNLNQVAFIWSWGSFSEPDGALFVGSVSSLSSATPVLAVGDELDFDDDGTADATIIDFNASTIAGPALDFSDHPWVYVNLELMDPSENEFDAIVRVPLNVPGPTCDGDCNTDGTVNVSDMLILLGNWGESSDCDLNGDGNVNVSDLLILLGNWGDCPG